jgi:hypothetical protein
VPFTLAHAAAAYPLRRIGLVLSALIIGTFAPDLEFFLRFAPHGPYGHTAKGLFYFSLPVALIVFWIFHALVKEPLAAMLPAAVREKIVAGECPLSLRRPLSLILVIVSILIGEATHMLWDSFTHLSYWPVQHIPLLKAAMTLPILGVVHVYKLLQYASTAFGLIAVFFWFRHWIRATPVQPNSAGSNVPMHQVRIARVLIPAVALAAAVVRAFLGIHHPSTPRGAEIWLGDFVVASISFAWLELMAWGLILPHRGPPLLAPDAPGSIK